jgi:serine/threonine-protein kinase
VARSTTVTAVTTGNAIPGTALYMAPEQASGRPVSGATDVYALGAVAYHCLTGEPPFSGDNPLQVALKHLQDPPPPLPDDIPAPVRTVVERALAKDPADRYPSAAALAAAARAALAATGGTIGLAAPLVMPPLIPPPGAIRTAGPGPTTARDLQPVGPLAAAAATRQRHRAAAIGVLVALLIAGGVLITALGLHSKGAPQVPAEQQTASSSPTVKTSRPGGRTASPTRQGPSSAPLSVAPPPISPVAPATTSAPPVRSAPPTTTTAPAPSVGGPTASGAPTAGGTHQAAYGAAGRHRVRGAATL